VRVIVETAAVRKLCSGESGPALLELKRVWSVPPRQRIDDWSVVSGLDEAFHATLVAATGNPELSRIHADIQERIRIVRRLDFTSGARVHCTYDEHAAIVKAILSRKGITGRAAALAHRDFETGGAQRSACTGTGPPAGRPPESGPARRRVPSGRRTGGPGFAESAGAGGAGQHQSLCRKP
jgi:DNA-binding GntR family transcriptional regulator